MTSLFISYSRRDIASARRLTGALKGRDLDFWIDWKGIPPSVEWWREIERGIEQANIFLFLLSPDSVRSKICRKEIKHAVKNGKRLIPVVVRDVSPSEAPVELRKLNWVFMRETDRFGKSVSTLITAIQSDYEWAQTHSQLQVKALEWQRSDKENSFLLQGRELLDAEAQLALNSSKAPIPTDLQREYVLLSRQTSDQQRKNRARITTVVALVLAVLAVFGFVQARLATSNAETAQAASTLAVANEETAVANQKLAEDRAKIARAGELVTQAASLGDSQFELSLLLGIEAHRTWDYFRTRSALFNNLKAMPYLKNMMTRHSGWISSLTVDPHGNHFASGGCSERDITTCMKGEILIWEIKDGYLEMVASFQSHASAVTSLRYNSEGTILASGGCAAMEEGYCSEGEIILWDARTNEMIGEPMKGHDDEIMALDFSPDGTTVASGSCGRQDGGFCYEGNIILWDVQTRSQIGEPLFGDTTWIGDLDFSPDGKLLASGSGHGKLVFWRLSPGASPEIAFTIEADHEIITAIEFSPDGNYLISGGVDDRIILWDVNSGAPVREFVPETGSSDVYSLAFSTESRIIAAGYSDGSVRVWDQQSGRELLTLHGHSGIVTRVAFTPDGKRILSTGQDARTILWDIDNEFPVGRIFRDDGFGTLNIGYDEKGNAVRAEYSNNSILVTDLTDNTPVRTAIHGFGDISFSTTLSPPINILAVGGEGFISSWDLGTGRLLFSESMTDQPNQVSSLAISHDESILAIGGCLDRDENLVCRSGKISFWDIADKQWIGNPIIAHTNWVDSLAFSPDDSLLVSGSSDDTIQIWDRKTNQKIGIPFLGHTGKINAIAFSPDGKTLASAGNDGMIILWDIETHQPIALPLHKQFSGIYALAFSPDGKNLLTADTDGKIMAWEVDPVQWINLTCRRIGRNITRDEWGLYFPGEEYQITCPQWPSGE